MLSKNDLFELKIEDMGVSGEGIGKYEGMAFFVKDAIIGDTIMARATKLKKNYGYARVEEVLVPSEYRVKPECELHKRCGGCQIQAMDYKKQLAFKQDKVRGNLIRIGGFAEEFVDSIMEPVVGMEHPYRYRNKAQFPIGVDKEGNIIAGFYASRTHSIIPVEDCKLGVPQNQEVLDCVIEYMRENRVAPYDERTGKGLVRHVLIRYGFTTKELMVCLIINGKKLPAQERLIEKLCKLDGMTSISVNQNMKNTNVILGDVTETIWGQGYITDYIHLRECRFNSSKDELNQKLGLLQASGTVDGSSDAFPVTDTAIAYHISPQSFYQVNPEQTEKLYSLALEYAGLTGNETVWDLYCGIGTISLFLAQKAGKVYGVEIVPQAIEDAKNNAKLNGITNAEFFVGKAEEVLPEFYERESRKVQQANACQGELCAGVASAKEMHAGETGGQGVAGADMLHPDVIVVDPPRKGCDEKCLETMLKMQPERIVYVSCDSATLARDLRILCDGGYELKKVRAVDQFGHTMHVETVVLLSQRKADDYVEVELELDELDVTSAESKATYAEIKEYVLKEYGLKVSNLYISQVKRKCGIEVGVNFNLSKSNDAKQPQCPKEKEEAIIEALKAFNMI